MSILVNLKIDGIGDVKRWTGRCGLMPAMKDAIMPLGIMRLRNVRAIRLIVGSGVGSFLILGVLILLFLLSFRVRRMHGDGSALKKMVRPIHIIVKLEDIFQLGMMHRWNAVTINLIVTQAAKLAVLRMIAEIKSLNISVRNWMEKTCHMYVRQKGRIMV